MLWTDLLSEGRFRSEKSDSTKVEVAPSWLVASRTESERDYDRVLFATPTRRLSDKTQVFPLEKNDSVRTRLTHSHEVADLARSIGTHIVHSPLFARIAEQFPDDAGIARARRAIPAILGTIGLAHDLGNPPFGHQGEAAISDWVSRKSSTLFEPADDPVKSADLLKMSSAHKGDFLAFEGNAQTLRTLTRLQVVKDNRGLNLTFGSLSALMKYTVSSDSVTGKSGPASGKKFGYFQSEESIFREVRAATGVPDGVRHPLTHIMEACDDAAYVIIDAEDAVKKQIVSFPDLLSWLESRPKLRNDPVAGWVLGKSKEALDEVRSVGLSPAEQNDVCTQIFRAYAISAIVSSIITSFEVKYDDIMSEGLSKPLLDYGNAYALIEEVRTFDRERAYSNRKVLEIELEGFNTIQGLMDMLWRGITEREDYEKPSSKRISPFARYAYGRISENYRRVFEGRASAYRESDQLLPVRYKELQLLTDMVAGMTDQYAVDLFRELKTFDVGASKY